MVIKLYTKPQNKVRENMPVTYGVFCLNKLNLSYAASATSVIVVHLVTGGNINNNKRSK